MGSRLLSFACSSYDSSQFQLSKMEAIKKKMQAMKVEKDNACDRVDASEEQCKAARLRASKAEDEVDELVTKSRQLEIPRSLRNCANQSRLTTLQSTNISPAKFQLILVQTIFVNWITKEKINLELAK